MAAAEQNSGQNSHISPGKGESQPRPWHLHQLLTSVKQAAEKGISIVPQIDELMRRSRPLSDDVPGWMCSQTRLAHDGYLSESNLLWYGLHEGRGGLITSVAFVLGREAQPDIMELAMMKNTEEISHPIPYLRRIPGSNPGEVVRATDYPQPSEEQLRSLSELSIIAEVPSLLQPMLSDVARRTTYNALRIVRPGLTPSGQPCYTIRPYDGVATQSSVRLAG